MRTFTSISVDQSQVRVSKAEAWDALGRVLGTDAVSAAAKLRHGPGRTCEPVARVIERAVSQARDAGLDPKGLTVASSRVEPGEDIVRVRRKAHGKADWITSVTSNISVELVPTGMYQSEHVQAEPVELPVVPSAQAPTGGDDSHPLVPEIRDRLLDVIDPDLGINIIDLGFVRKIAVENRTAILTMTLTSAACPLTGVMEDQIRTELLGDEALVDDFRIDWEWTPAWTPAEISPEGRDQLRAIGFTI
jgi:metal-sulfur cluster biosynthetic enzyme/ribosomal protein L22